MNDMSGKGVYSRIIEPVKLKKGLKWATIYFSGGALYGAIEVIVRRNTHISMLLLGGLCLVILIKIAQGKAPRFFKCVLGALIITLLEFVTGVIVNIWMQLNVWDYSDRFLNIYGQICPKFTVYWFLLSFVVFYLYDRFMFRLSSVQSQADAGTKGSFKVDSSAEDPAH